MIIIVNGIRTKVPATTTVASFLANTNHKREYTAVAVNRACVPRCQYETHHLQDQDQLEILVPMAGG